MNDRPKTDRPKTAEEYAAQLTERIKTQMAESGAIHANGPILTFEGEQYPIKEQRVSTTVNMIVSHNNQPVDIQRAYNVSIAACEAYLHALAEARATVQMQAVKIDELATKVGDLQSELQRLRGQVGEVDPE